MSLVFCDESGKLSNAEDLYSYTMQRRHKNLNRFQSGYIYPYDERISVDAMIPAASQDWLQTRIEKDTKISYIEQVTGHMYPYDERFFMVISTMLLVNEKYIVDEIKTFTTVKILSDYE
jgi:hypothetical protein